MHKTDAAASFRASWLENASELLLENQFFVLFSDFVTFFSFFFKREGELPSPHISLNDCLVLLFSRSSLLTPLVHRMESWMCVRKQRKFFKV